MRLWNTQQLDDFVSREGLDRRVFGVQCSPSSRELPGFHGFEEAGSEVGPTVGQCGTEYLGVDDTLEKVDESRAQVWIVNSDCISNTPVLVGDPVVALEGEHPLRRIVPTQRGILLTVPVSDRQLLLGP